MRGGKVRRGDEIESMPCHGNTVRDRIGEDSTAHFDSVERTFLQIAGMSEIASAQSEKDSLRVAQQVRVDQSEEWYSFLLVLGAYYEDALGCQ